jgi:hypothetical protein
MPDYLTLNHSDISEKLTRSQFNIELGRCRGNPEALKRFLMRVTRKPSVRVRLSGEVSKTTINRMSLTVKKELAERYDWQ